MISNFKNGFALSNIFLVIFLAWIIFIQNLLENIKEATTVRKKGFVRPTLH
jgi:hypothetical protein